MKRFVLVAVTALALAACGSGFSDIQGEWRLESGTYDGRPITLVDGHPITLNLIDGEISGTAACNRYSGTYRVNDGTFQITQIAWTEMACFPAEAMDSEREFLTALGNVESAEVVDGMLVMSGSRSELVFEEMKGTPSAAESPTDEPNVDAPTSGAFGLTSFGDWQLVSGSADGESIPTVASHPITLSVGEDSIGGTAACNNYFHDGLSDDGPPVFGVTEMACSPAEVMNSERAYLAALARVTEAALEDGLVLTGDGVELVFRALEPVAAAELLGTVWVLDGLVRGDTVSSVVAGSRATLELFSDGSFIGSTGCRTISGSYVVNGAEIVFTTFGADGECPAHLRNQDSRVISALEGGFRVDIEEDRMTTWVPGDEGLIYRAMR